MTGGISVVLMLSLLIISGHCLTHIQTVLLIFELISFMN